jgi:hypothetical protein
MHPWEQLVWDLAPETDAHLEERRNPYRSRELQMMLADLRRRKLRITDFVSQYAIGDSRACSLELLLRSRRLLDQSRVQILRIRMRLLMYHSGRSVQ